METFMLTLFLIIGILFSRGNAQIDVLNQCAIQDRSVTLTCSMSPVPIALFSWQFNSELVTLNCQVVEPPFADTVVVEECSFADGKYIITISNFAEEFQGTWTCRGDAETDSVELNPNLNQTEIVYGTAASDDANDPANIQQSLTSHSEDSVTLTYEPPGCYYPDPLFTWYDQDNNEISDGVDTTEITPNTCEFPEQKAYSSSVDLTFPSEKSTVQYSCRVSYQESPECVVNEKIFSLKTNYSCPPGLCIALPVVLIVSATAAIAGFVIYKKKKQNTTM